MHTFDLGIGEIAKIEGKAYLNVAIKEGKIDKCEFGISEFKRFYTQALRGKDIIAVPQLTARICGTCSNAHLLCALKAVEDGIGLVPSEQTMLLRKLVNYGLLIRDHALHLYVFVLPDMMGVDNILELSEDIPEQHQMLDDCFGIKAAGNNLSKVVGGRSVHAPNLTVGGFTKLPSQDDLNKQYEALQNIRPAVLRTIKLFYECKFTKIHKQSYAALLDENFDFLSGKVFTSLGQSFDSKDYGKYLEHVVVPYSHASGYHFNGQIYLVGALARINLGKQFLHPNTIKDASDALSVFPSDNVYHNNLAQAIEILHSIDKALDILKSMKIAQEPPVQVVRKAGVGTGVIEAPRGTLFYKLNINDKGTIDDVQIVVPTGQNQISIEKSIRGYLEENLDKPKDHLIQEIEQIVRSYDPCMSCASHFLKVKWKRV